MKKGPFLKHKIKHQALLIHAEPIGLGNGLLSLKRIVTKCSLRLRSGNIYCLLAIRLEPEIRGYGADCRAAGMLRTLAARFKRQASKSNVAKRTLER